MGRTAFTVLCVCVREVIVGGVLSICSHELLYMVDQREGLAALFFGKPPAARLGAQKREEALHHLRVSWGPLSAYAYYYYCCWCLACTFILCCTTIPLVVAALFVACLCFAANMPVAAQQSLVSVVSWHPYV